MAAVLTFILQFVLAVIMAVDVNYVTGLLGITISTWAWVWIAGGISVISLAGTICLIALYWQIKREETD